MTNDTRSIISACLISTAGAIVYLISPVLLGSSMDSLGLSARQSGLALSAYFAGYSLVTVSAVLWLHRCNRRIVGLVSLLALVAGLIVAALLGGYGNLLAGMALSGAGAGMLFGLSVVVIAETNNPDRNFGTALAVQLALGSLLLFLGPAVIAPRWGLSGILVATAGFVIIMGLGLPWIPHGSAKHADSVSGTARESTPLAPVLAGVFALLVWFTGYSGIYAFVERIGVAGGLDGLTIGTVLSAMLVTGISGAISAAVIADRFGRVGPQLAGLAGTLIALVLLHRNPGLIRYSVAMGFLTFSWNFWLAYLLGAIAWADFQGRFAVLTTAALGLGATLGPGISGSLGENGDYLPILVFTAICVAVGLSLTLWVLAQARAFRDSERAKAAIPQECQ